MRKMIKAIAFRAIAILAGMTIGVLSLHRPVLADTLNTDTLMLAQAPTDTATAVIRSTDGTDTELGEATFRDLPEGMTIDVSLNGVPSGYHGFHIHEFGSCDDGGSSAGGHFNPRGVKHGYLPKDGFENAHVGDLGNIFIGSNGSGTMDLTVPGLSLTEGDEAIANHAVILHAERDDFGQPTGNAGGRIGCGIIE